MEPQQEPIQSSESAGLSLDELSQAFAAMQGHNAAATGGQLPPRLDGLNDDRSSDLEAHSAGELLTSVAEKAPVPSLRSIVEAMLFTGQPDNSPITSQLIASIVRGVSPEEIDQQIHDLNAQYAENRAPYAIVAEEAGYRLALRGEHGPLRERIQGKIRATRLSPAAIEVLALVAYNEPVSADQVTRMRGTPSGHVLSYLVRRQLLRIERTDTRPRKTSYFTTKRFLDLFQLRSLQDLPRSDDLARQ